MDGSTPHSDSRLKLRRILCFGRSVYLRLLRVNVALGVALGRVNVRPRGPRAPQLLELGHARRAVRLLVPVGRGRAGHRGAQPPPRCALARRRHELAVKRVVATGVVLNVIEMGRVRGALDPGGQHKVRLARCAVVLRLRGGMLRVAPGNTRLRMHSIRCASHYP